MNLAIKDIRANLFKFVLTALGVGMLLLAARSMAGVYRGIVADALALIQDSGADLWVVQAGTEGPFSEGSQVDRSLVERARGVPGVASARQFVLAQKRFQIGARVVRGSLLGLDFPTDRGGWLPVVAGRALAVGSGEALADASIGLKLGDSFTVGSQTCRIVGLFRGLVDSSGNPIIAASVNDVLEMNSYRASETILLERAAGIPVRSAQQGAISAVMIGLAPGVDGREAARTMSSWGDVAVLSRQEECDVLLLGRLDKLAKQILLFLIILMIVSTVVISVTIYTMTMEKRHEIALLKLIGAKNRTIVRMIFEQALCLGGLAFVFALLAGRMTGPLFPRKLVQPAGDTVLFGFSVLIICTLGSGIGIWKALGVRAQEVLS